MQTLNRCPDGGFLSLQTDLASSKPLKGCPACDSMLKQAKFDQADLDKLINDFLANGAITKAKTCKGPKLDIDAADKNEDGADKLEDGENAKATVQDKVAAREESLEYLKQFAGVIELLPPGTAGKKVPFRCLLCQTRSQPNGKVLELSQLRPHTVQYFVEKHLNCNSHKKNAKLAEGTAMPSQTRVPCQGLSIADAASAGRLHVFRREFELWATVCNFQDNASHQYWQDAGTWHVRSERCEKETTLCPTMERQVCAQCLVLGSAKSVPRLFRLSSLHGTRNFDSRCVFL